MLLTLMGTHATTCIYSYLCSSRAEPQGPLVGVAPGSWPSLTGLVEDILPGQLQWSVGLLLPSSVGTFARALDCSSSVRQPSLHMSAAAASRDITLVSGLLATSPASFWGPAAT